MATKGLFRLFRFGFVASVINAHVGQGDKGFDRNIHADACEGILPLHAGTVAPHAAEFSKAMGITAKVHTVAKTAERKNLFHIVDAAGQGLTDKKVQLRNVAAA